MVKIREMERNANFSSVFIIIHTDPLKKSRIYHLHFIITERIAEEKMERSYVDNIYPNNHLVVKIGVVLVCSLPLMTLLFII